jgi:hypothetical protein
MLPQNHTPRIIVFIILGLTVLVMSVAVYLFSSSTPGVRNTDILLSVSSAPMETPRPALSTSLAMSKIPVVLKQLIEQDVQDSFVDISFDTVTYSSQNEDFNNDGIFEHVIRDFIFDDIPWAGASGNGPIMLYGIIDDDWKNIGTVEGNTYYLLESMTHGYRDIQTTWHMSATTYIMTTYLWNESLNSYEMIKSEDGLR